VLGGLLLAVPDSPKLRGIVFDSPSGSAEASRQLEARGLAERLLRPVFAELAGMSHRGIAAELNARKIPTPAGGRWHAVTVKRVLARLG